MQQYLDLLGRILDDGIARADRTGTGTIGVFGHQMRFDLAKGFPCLTTKKLHLKSIIHELLWFLRGETNVAALQSVGVKIWNEWADETGELGPIYGYQWRSWPLDGRAGLEQGRQPGQSIDQIQRLIDGLRSDPYSRRHIVSAWNVAQLEQMALPPCHCLFQFHVAQGRLSCQLYQRSADVFLGVPFNIASYALFTLMVAEICDLQAGEFVHTLGDAHLYANHLEQARIQRDRAPRKLPEMHITRRPERLEDFRFEDFELRNYDPLPHIPAPISV